MTNNIFANNFKKVFSVGLTATLIVSGFFVANIAHASNTWTVNPECTADTPINGDCNDSNIYKTIQAAIDAASEGDTINVSAGTYIIDSSIDVNKSVTITTDASATIVSVTLDTPVFNITADNVTIEKFNIITNLAPFSRAEAVTGSETSGALVFINAENATINNNTIYANETSLGGMATWTVRGITLQSGSAEISGNTIYGVRNGIVVRPGNTATMTDNVIFDTKGGIMNYTSDQADADNRIMNGNSWGTTHNEWDIVWNSAKYVPDYQQSVLDLSTANNNAYVVDRRDANLDAMALGNRSHVFISLTGATSAHEAKGNFNEPFATIALGVDAVVPGGTVNVAAGTYNESVLIGQPLTLLGSGVTKPVITGFGSGQNYIVKIDGADNITLNGLEINGGGLMTGENNFTYGILISNSGDSTNPVVIENSLVKNIWQNGSNGIGVENSSYVLVHDNVISSFHKRGIRFINSDGKFYSNDVKGDSVDGTTRVQNLVNLWGGSTVEIYSNTLHDAKSLPGTPIWDSPGIFVSSYGGSGASYANIHDNEIYNGDTGIVIGSVYAKTDTSSADILDNNLHNLNWAINFEKETISVIIHRNKFTSVNKAVSAEVSTGSLENPPAVDAKNNWWGISDQAGITDFVYNGVDFDPWYVNLEMTILSAAVSGGNTIIGSDSDIALGSGGTANLPNGITNLILSNNSNLNLSAGLSGVVVTLNSGTDDKPIVLTNSNLSGVSASIPDGTKITGPADWNGIIIPPTFETPSGNAPAGFSVGNTVIYVGSSQGKLTFSNPVTLLLSGVTGAVGYRPFGLDTTWVQIIDACTVGSYDSPTGAVSPGECAISNGTDTKILTYHFTSFGSLVATPTPVSTPAPSSGGYYPSTPTPTPAGEVLGIATFNFTTDLRFGMEGNDITELQKRLTVEGVYSGPITGYFGQLTLQAVKTYQSKVGVSATGFVGPLTRGQLNTSQVAGASTANVEALRTQIASIQAQLITLIQQLIQMLQADLQAQQ